MSTLVPWKEGFYEFYETGKMADLKIHCKVRNVNGWLFPGIGNIVIFIVLTFSLRTEYWIIVTALSSAFHLRNSFDKFFSKITKTFVKMKGFPF